MILHYVIPDDTEYALKSWELTHTFSVKIVQNCDWLFLIEI
jgi:hypothetical protein